MGGHRVFHKSLLHTHDLLMRRDEDGGLECHTPSPCRFLAGLQPHRWQYLEDVEDVRVIPQSRDWFQRHPFP